MTGENNPTTQTLTMVDAERLDVPQKLPTIPANSSDNIWRITKETLVGCMDGQFDQYFDHMIIIDCRFRYEYKGGHIDGAISLAPRSGSLVDTNLLDDLIPSKSHQMRTVICFYCEHSKYRAPIVAARVRSKDRLYNIDRYPSLTYHHIYILDGGYSNFFQSHPNRCVPQEYVRMTDSAHRKLGGDEINLLRQVTKSPKRRRSGLYATSNSDQKLEGEIIKTSPILFEDVRLDNHTAEACDAEKPEGQIISE
ncbi:Nitrogen assimilation transcription factor nirA [Fusarium oxysporum f. sp. albedinis]|nr:Nitrogen assimilation transcription factor nirA [Fusarium oxysporum f. sp. albedinis]